MRQMLLPLYALMMMSVSSIASGMSWTSEWVGKKAPEISKGDWINSGPLTLRDLRGKVVLVEFWTYGCINCRNTLPFMKDIYARYRSKGLEIIGVHSPEFEQEKQLANVRRRAAALGIKYPVVTDNDYETWTSYKQHYWPVMYLIDKQGVIRYVHIGEGEYDTTEQTLQGLLNE